MHYCHTQHAPLKLILYAVATLLAISAWLARGEAVLALVLAVAAGTVAVLGLSFHSLTVSDQGARLSIRYGPLPLFGKSIDYSHISHVEPGRSSLIDGWGIHYVPGRGWTYNLWGRDCAIFQMKNKTVRIGTDDVDNLVDFLKLKTRSANP